MPSASQLYRMATISDEDGNSTLPTSSSELQITDDGALSLGEIIDVGDALCIVGRMATKATPTPAT